MVSIAFRVGLNGNNPDVDGHVVPQVLVPCNEGGSELILETDTARSAVVDTIEVLDGGHN